MFVALVPSAEVATISRELAVRIVNGRRRVVLILARKRYNNHVHRRIAVAVNSPKPPVAMSVPSL